MPARWLSVLDVLASLARDLGDRLGHALDCGDCGPDDQ